MRSASREDLGELDLVKKALSRAEVQIAACWRALEKRSGDALDLRAWSVVAVGFERLVARPFTLGPDR